jgi:hypothetical protein
MFDAIRNAYPPDPGGGIIKTQRLASTDRPANVQQRRSDTGPSGDLPATGAVFWRKSGALPFEGGAGCGLAATILRMSDESQIEVPPSFIALFVEPGRTKPNAPRAEISQRYEFCEDLASMLTESAQARLWELGITEADVLERIHTGLLGGQAGVNPAEAEWVTRRLAELLGWEPR